MITGSQSHPQTLEPPPEQPDTTPVEEVLRALAAAVRSYRLYERSNPMVERFVTTLRQKMEAVWDTLPYLRLRIEEHAIRWEDQLVFPTGDSGGDLPFIFYKDGIRELTILPGFEESELLALLGVLARAPTVQEDQDDLITLLWQEEFTHLRYRAVEAGAEGIELYRGAAEPPQPLDPQVVREEEPPPQQVTTDDFEESLYFLDDVELRRLREEVLRESQRDLWRDVMNALLDRLEDGKEERQLRIVGLLGELLPTTLANGQFDRAASLLEELAAVAARPGVLSDSALRETHALFRVMGSEETVTQLTSLLEESPGRLSEGLVERLLGFFPPAAIGPLMRSADRTQQPAVRRVLESCIERLAGSAREELGELLRGEDRAVVTGALGWIGRLKIGSSLAEVVRHLRSGDPGIRAAAASALGSLDAPSAGNMLLPLLDDPEREVRITTARALGSLRSGSARPALETALSSKRLHDADRTEKLAFFEAYGRVAGPDGVPVLDRILNSRNWMGRGESAEYRACAALGLARIRDAAATRALNAAANDKDAVVRAAVMRALRGETD